MLEPLINPTDTWAKRDLKHDLAFRPLETALLSGKVDAIYALSKVIQHLQEDTGKIKAIEDLSQYPDWTLQVANTPAVITCSDVMAKEHPELVVTYMKAMIKVGRWANQFKQAAAVILDRQTTSTAMPRTPTRASSTWTWCPTCRPRTWRASRSARTSCSSHGYIKNDFDVHEWAAPEFFEQAAKELLEEEWKKKTAEKLPEVTELQAESRRIG